MTIAPDDRVLAVPQLVSVVESSSGTLQYGAVGSLPGAYDPEVGWVGAVAAEPRGCGDTGGVRAGVMVGGRWRAIGLPESDRCDSLRTTTPFVVSTAHGVGLFYREFDSSEPLRYGILDGDSLRSTTRVGATPDRSGGSRDMDVRAAVLADGRRIVFAEHTGTPHDACFRLRMMDANGDHACPARWRLACEDDENLFTEYAEVAAADLGAAVVWGERPGPVFRASDHDYHQEIKFAVLNSDGQRISNTLELYRWEGVDLGLGTIPVRPHPLVDADGPNVFVAWNDGTGGRAPAYVQKITCTAD